MAQSTYRKLNPMEYMHADKGHRTAGECSVDVTIRLSEDELDHLILANPGNSPLKSALGETRGFLALSRVNVSDLVIVRYLCSVHPLNATQTVIRREAREIFAGVESIAQTIMDE